MKKDTAPPPRRAPGWPQGEDDMINRFGTFEVQATCGTENPFPQIAQGTPGHSAQAVKAEEARQRSRERKA